MKIVSKLGMAALALGIAIVMLPSQIRALTEPALSEVTVLANSSYSDGDVTCQGAELRIDWGNDGTNDRTYSGEFPWQPWLQAPNQCNPSFFSVEAQEDATNRLSVTITATTQSGSEVVATAEGVFEDNWFFNQYTFPGVLPLDQGDLPDLVPISFYPYENYSVPGGTFEMYWSVANEGLIDAWNAGTDVVYLSRDDHLGGAEDIYLTSWPGDPVSAGNDYPSPILRIWIPDDITGGDYYLILSVDDGNSVVEANEDNNTTTAPLYINGPPPTYSVSGQVTDASNDPISGANISASSSISTMTDSNGNYMLKGLAAGTHTLTPSKSGYTFSPPTVQVTVPPDATDVRLNGTKVLPTVDVALVQPIGVGSKVSPYAPNHLTLETSVRNQSTSVDASNVAVSFYDGDPDTGGQQIGSVPISFLGSGVSQTISITWTLPGNIENHRVYARASSLASVDPNLANNTVSRPISVYYTNFRHDEDAYSFVNGPGGIQYSTKDLRTDVETMIREYGLYREWTTGILTYIVGRTVASGGYCYGISGTSVLYKLDNELKPVSPSIDTFDMTVPQSRGNIEHYQRRQLIDFLYQSISGSLDKRTTYEATRDSIIANKPLIHGLRNVSTQAGHAVVAYKIVELDDERRVFYYDPNKPLASLEREGQESYGTFHGNTFTYPGYDDVYLMSPSISTDHLRRAMTQLVSRWIQDAFQRNRALIVIEGMLNSNSSNALVPTQTSSVLLYDPQGRRIGVIDGTVVNEIPGATVEMFGSFSMFELPRDIVYTAEASGITGDTLSLYANFPVTQSTVRSLTYSSVTVSSAATATVTLGLTNTNTALSVGDRSIEPNIDIITEANNVVYVPLVRR